MFAGKKSAQIREILISESAWEEMTCLFAPSLVVRAGAVNDYHAGENITIHFDMAKCHFFDTETEVAIQ